MHFAISKENIEKIGHHLGQLLESSVPGKLYVPLLDSFKSPGFLIPIAEDLLAKILNPAPPAPPQAPLAEPPQAPAAPAQEGQ